MDLHDSPKAPPLLRAAVSQSDRADMATWADTPFQFWPMANAWGCHANPCRRSEGVGAVGATQPLHPIPSFYISLRLSKTNTTHCHPLAGCGKHASSVNFFYQELILIPTKSFAPPLLSSPPLLLFLLNPSSFSNTCSISDSHPRSISKSRQQTCISSLVLPKPPHQQLPFALPSASPISASISSSISSSATPPALPSARQPSHQHSRQHFSGTQE